jgi:hypothetical protein
VALAAPISTALPMSNCSAKRGPQAIAVPWPPTSDTEPASSPTSGSSPSRLAVTTPVRFCSTMNTTVAASRISSGQPPLRSVRTSALRPMPAKK